MCRHERRHKRSCACVYLCETLCRGSYLRSCSMMLCFFLLVISQPSPGSWLVSQLLPIAAFWMLLRAVCRRLTLPGLSGGPFFRSSSSSMKDRPINEWRSSHPPQNVWLINLSRISLLVKRYTVHTVYIDLLHYSALTKKKLKLHVLMYANASIIQMFKGLNEQTVSTPLKWIRTPTQSLLPTFHLTPGLGFNHLFVLFQQRWLCRPRILLVT